MGLPFFEGLKIGLKKAEEGTIGKTTNGGKASEFIADG
jgi:hypothetical protein